MNQSGVREPPERRRQTTRARRARGQRRAGGAVGRGPRARAPADRRTPRHAPATAEVGQDPPRPRRSRPFPPRAANAHDSDYFVDYRTQPRTGTGPVRAESGRSLLRQLARRTHKKPHIYSARGIPPARGRHNKRTRLCAACSGPWCRAGARSQPALAFHL